MVEVSLKEKRINQQLLGSKYPHVLATYKQLYDLALF